MLAWITAMRLRTLPVSISGVLCAMAYALMDGVFKWLPAVLCLLFAILAQIASNFANEYYDYKGGLDKPGREGPRRGVTEGDITPSAMRNATIGVLALACLIGLSLVYWGGWWLILAGIVIVAGVLAYSAGPYPLSHHGWGEVAVVFFFGIIPVNLTYYVMALHFDLSVMIGSVSIGLMGANVLIVNNYRDYDDDKVVGKHTLAVICGRNTMPDLYLANGWVAALIMLPAWIGLAWSNANFAILIIPLIYIVLHTLIWKNMKRTTGRSLNKYLGMTAVLMMAYSMLLLLTASCASSKASDQVPTTNVEWQLVGHNDDNSYTHRILVTGDLDFDMLAFNALPCKVKAVSEGDTLIEIIPGYYAVASSRFGADADSLVIELNTSGIYRNIAYAPDSFHKILSDGSTRPVAFVQLPLTDHAQWAMPGGNDRMPYGDEIYELNEAIRPEGKVPVYDAVPSYKKVTPGVGTSRLPLAFAWHQTHGDNPEYYTLAIRNDSLIVGAANEKLAREAAYSFLKKYGQGNGTLPNATIEDYPDFGYRGLMIDISRNYQTPATMKRIIDYMREYRMNVLHFHIVDDEAWRVEMPSLPELTAVGGRRGYTRDENDFLAQVYSGNGDPDADVPCANGYFTREDFIDFIKYADDHGIMVLPEIECPGHARAAVRAMENRYRRTGDDSMRLIHDGDTSEYSSAQAYHDNVMNPALESTYKFMETVIGDLAQMYEDAGVPLPAIHIGGDEVAKGAWDGSEVALRFIAENNLDGQTGLHGYFVRRINEILRNKGLKISGWQEIAMGHTPEYDADMAPRMYSVNCWHNGGPMLDRMLAAAEKGYPLVLSNVDHFYMDQCYNYHPMENGLTWGAVVDELASLDGYPWLLCPATGKAKENIIGVSGQLFAETLRTPEQLELYLFPKMLGLAERGWNADSTYSHKAFMAVIEDHDMPRWADEGRNFHVRQPGIKIEDGKALMNSPYQGGEIHYTLDGSEPTEASPIYREAIDLSGATDVRAAIYMHGKRSLTTYVKQK